jgi:hypothetical protein
VTWDGNGSQSDPFTPEVPLPLETLDTSTLATTLTSEGGEYVLSVQPLAAVGQVWLFESDGVWNDPGGLTVLRVLMVAGGGGGGGGVDDRGSDRWLVGGGGGASGAVLDLTLTGPDIPASAVVTIGQGGSGGLPGSPSSTPPVAGADGGDTLFDIYRCLGGGGGPGGTRVLFNAVSEPPVPGFGVAPANGGTSLGDDGHPLAPVNRVLRLAPGGGGAGGSYYGADGSQYLPGRKGGYSHPGRGDRTSGYQADPLVHRDGYDEPVTLMGSGGAGGVQNDPGGGTGGLYGAGGGGGSGIQTPLSPAAPGFALGGSGADGVCLVMGW